MKLQLLELRAAHTVPSQQATLTHPGSAHVARNETVLSTYSLRLFHSLLLSTPVHALPPLLPLPSWPSVYVWLLPHPPS